MKCQKGKMTQAESIIGSSHYFLRQTLNMVMVHLTGTLGADVHGKGVVSINASSKGSRSGCDKVASSEWNGPQYIVFNGQNQWVGFDFETRRVCLIRHACMLKSEWNGDNWPLDWVNEGSHDDHFWNVIDGRDRKDFRED